jgi:hypothetical protein
MNLCFYEPVVNLSSPGVSCSTSPHGGSIVGSLILSGAAALTATMYAITSCRFFVVSFTSETGGFEEYFSNSQSAGAGRSVVLYKTGIGLFQWLRPFDLDGEWSNGSCAGYQDLMRDQVSDALFETARVFASLAVIASCFLFLWSIALTCFENNQLQIILFCVCSFAGTVCSGMTFLLARSSLCHEQFATRECTLDEGGLVMIAGTILWLASFVLSVMFMRPSPYEPDDLENNRPLTAEESDKLAYELAKQRARAKKHGARAKKQHAGTPDTHQSYSFDSPVSGRSPQQEESASRPRASVPGRVRTTQLRQSAAPPPPSSTNRPRLSPDPRERRIKQKPSLTVDDVTAKNEMEVYIKKRLDRIEALTEV